MQLRCAGRRRGHRAGHRKVVLGAHSVVFRSLLRNGTRVGCKSAVVGGRTQLGRVVGHRTIYADDAVSGPVEW